MKKREAVALFCVLLWRSKMGGRKRQRKGERAARFEKIDLLFCFEKEMENAIGLI
jgi:hypothetical protein